MEKIKSQMIEPTETDIKCAIIGLMQDGKLFVGSPVYDLNEAGKKFYNLYTYCINSRTISTNNYDAEVVLQITNRIQENKLKEKIKNFLNDN